MLRALRKAYGDAVGAWNKGSSSDKTSWKKWHMSCHKGSMGISQERKEEGKEVGDSNTTLNWQGFCQFTVTRDWEIWGGERQEMRMQKAGAGWRRAWFLILNSWGFMLTVMRSHWRAAHRRVVYAGQMFWRKLQVMVRNSIVKQNKTILTAQIERW